MKFYSKKKCINQNEVYLLIMYFSHHAEMNGNQLSDPVQRSFKWLKVMINLCYLVNKPEYRKQLIRSLRALKNQVQHEVFCNSANPDALCLLPYCSVTRLCFRCLRLTECVISQREKSGEGEVNISLFWTHTAVIWFEALGLCCKCCLEKSDNIFSTK